MAVMGRYCKAYSVGALEQYPAWQPKAVQPREDDGIPAEIVFIQEDYTVTRGVFLDENVVFDEITPEWKLFCEQVLQFRIPEDLPVVDEPTEDEQTASKPSM